MTFVVPIGPQHPAIKEPEYFRIEVKGEEITNVDIRMGYMHRGIEQALAERPYAKGVYLAERVCGICSAAHTTCFIQTAEQLAGIEVPDRALYIRTIIAELERIHSHLLWAGVAAHQIGFMTLFMLIWRDRELVMDMLELVSGNRVNYSTNTLGGVRRDIGDTKAVKILRNMDELEKHAKHYVDVFRTDRTILARCRNLGVLTKEDALKLCAVGPTIRGSDVDTDIRRDDPYAAYDKIDFDVITEKEGDILAKALVRLREVLESIYIVRRAIAAMPSGPIRSRVKKLGEKFPEGEAAGRIEAPRGELLYYIQSHGGENPYRVRIRTPTIANIPPIQVMLVGETIAEVPIVVESIDQCFACADRVTVVDTETRKSRVLTMKEMREMHR